MYNSSSSEGAIILAYQDRNRNQGLRVTGDSSRGDAVESDLLNTSVVPAIELLWALRGEETVDAAAYPPPIMVLLPIPSP